MALSFMKSTLVFSSSNSEAVRGIIIYKDRRLVKPVFHWVAISARSEILDKTPRIVARTPTAEQNALTTVGDYGKCYDRHTMVVVLSLLKIYQATSIKTRQA